ncbi:MAG: TIGR02594 family protein [Pseudomonadota bacterium]
MKAGMLAGVPIPEVQSNLEGLDFQARNAGETLRFAVSDNPKGGVDIGFFVMPKDGIAAAELLGELSRRYEVGTRGPETISGGVGDPGGKSYGCWQMCSEPAGGTVAEFIDEPGFPFADAFAGADPGSAGFDAAWKALVQRDKAAFEEAQRSFIQRTHYEVQRKKLLALGIDVATRSRALQDVLWSTAVQHRNAAVQIFHSAATDDEAAMIKAIYAERGRRRPDGVLAHFQRCSAQVQASVAKRFVDECADALAMLAAEEKRPKPVVFVAANPPKPVHTGHATTGSSGDEAPEAAADAQQIPAWFKIAREEEGQAELPGAADNPRIVEYFSWTSGGARPDAVPWCAAFVSFCVGTAGFLRKGTGSALAGDWMHFGKALDAPRPGCIVVLKPQAPGASGHVGFWVKTEAGRVHLLGGNQADKVMVAPFKAADIRDGGLRWPSGA